MPAIPRREGGQDIASIARHSRDDNPADQPVCNHRLPLPPTRRSPRPQKRVWPAPGGNRFHAARPAEHARTGHPGVFPEPWRSAVVPHGSEPRALDVRHRLSNVSLRMRLDNGHTEVVTPVSRTRQWRRRRSSRTVKRRVRHRSTPVNAGERRALCLALGALHGAAQLPSARRRRIARQLHDQLPHPGTAFAQRTPHRRRSVVPRSWLNLGWSLESPTPGGPKWPLPSFSWSPERESNPRPTHYECVALPTELSGRTGGGS